MNEKGSVSSIFNCEGVAKNGVRPLAEKPVVAVLTVSENSRSIGCVELGESGNCQAVPLIDQRACPYLRPMESQLSSQAQVASVQGQEESTVANDNISAEVPVEPSATVQLREEWLEYKNNKYKREVFKDLFLHSFLRRNRRQRFWQKDLAESLGINKQTVSRWANGVTMPGILHSLAIGRELEMPADERAMLMVLAEHDSFDELCKERSRAANQQDVETEAALTAIMLDMFGRSDPISLPAKNVRPAMSVPETKGEVATMIASDAESGRKYHALAEELRSLWPGRMTNYEFAYRIGVNAQTVSNWINGRSRPSGLTLLRICKELKLEDKAKISLFSLAKYDIAKLMSERDRAIDNQDAEGEAALTDLMMKMLGATELAPSRSGVLPRSEITPPSDIVEADRIEEILATIDRMSPTAKASLTSAPTKAETVREFSESDFEESLHELHDIVQVDEVDRRHTSGGTDSLRAESDYQGAVDLFDRDDLALKQACDGFRQKGSVLGELPFQPWGDRVTDSYLVRRRGFNTYPLVKRTVSESKQVLG